jgi:hypothetical protein
MLSSFSLLTHGQIGPILLVVLFVLNLVVTVLRLVLTLARLTQILAHMGEWITSLSSEQLHSLINRIGAIIHDIQEEAARHSGPAEHSIPALSKEHQAGGEREVAQAAFH